MTNASANAPGPGGQSGYGKSAAAILAGSGGTILVLIVNQILKSHGMEPMSAELTDAIQTFITTAAVFLTPHNALGGG